MLKKLSAAVGFALLAGSAQAATVTYVSSASLEAVEINQSLSLDLFDPFYYGTLTAVSLELRSEAQFAFSLTAELNSQFPGNEGDVNILTQGSIAFSSSLADLDGKLIWLLVMLSGIPSMAKSFSPAGSGEGRGHARGRDSAAGDRHSAALATGGSASGHDHAAA